MEHDSSTCDCCKKLRRQGPRDPDDDDGGGFELGAGTPMEVPS